MSVLWWILFAVIWIAIAFWPARVAGRKGHSFIGYFIFSLFFFPAAIIVAYLVPTAPISRAGPRRCQLVLSAGPGGSPDLVEQPGALQPLGEVIHMSINTKLRGIRTSHGSL